MLKVALERLCPFGLWATLFLQQVEGINEIAVVGKDYKTACREIAGRYVPNKIIMGAAESSDNFPMLQTTSLANTLLIHLCKNYSCLPPFTSVQNLLDTLLPPVIA